MLDELVGARARAEKSWRARSKAKTRIRRRIVARMARKGAKGGQGGRAAQCFFLLDRTFGSRSPCKLRFLVSTDAAAELTVCAYVLQCTQRNLDRPIPVPVASRETHRLCLAPTVRRRAPTPP